MSEQSIISRAFESLSQQLDLIVKLLIQNYPKTDSFDSPNGLNLLKSYLEDFFLVNNPIRSQLNHIVSISKVDPVGSTMEFYDLVPEINFGTDYVPPARITYLSWVKRDLLTLPHVQTMLKLLTNIICSTFFELLVSTIDGPAKPICESLLDTLIRKAIPRPDDPFPKLIYSISSQYWSRALLYLCPLTRDSVFAYVMTFLKGLIHNEASWNQMNFIFYSGFNPISFGNDHLLKFTHEFPSVLQYISNNLTNLPLINSAMKFLFNFFGITTTLCPTFNFLSVFNPLQKTLPKITKLSGKQDNFGYELHSLLLSIGSEHNISNNVNSFIQKELIPLLDNPNRAATSFKSFVILLRGNNYKHQVLLDSSRDFINWAPKNGFLSQAIRDEFFSRVIKRITNYRESQKELACYLIQLSVLDIKAFLSNILPEITSPMFINHNSYAFLNTIASLMSIEKTRAVFASKDNPIIRMLSKFNNEYNIALAPSELLVFHIPSFSGTLQSTKLPLFTLLEQLSQLSHPLPIIDMAPKNLNIRRNNKSSEGVSTNLFEQTLYSLRSFDGYTSPNDFQCIEDIGALFNLTSLTSFDRVITQCLISLIMSSSVEIAAMSIDAIQATIHRYPHSFPTIIQNVAGLIQKSPTIEPEHLHRIVYSMKQIIESALYLNINTDKLSPIINIGILGLCSDHHIIRIESHNLLIMSQQIIGHGLYSGFLEDSLISTEAPLATCQKSHSHEIVSHERLRFFDVLQSSYNNIYRFYLAYYGKYLRNHSEFMYQSLFEFLYECLRFFEFQTVSKSFIENIFTLLINSITLSNIKECDIRNLWILVVEKSQQSDGFQFSSSLFCAIDCSIVPYFIRPIDSLLVPISFAVINLVETYHDEEFMVEFIHSITDLLGFLKIESFNGSTKQEKVVFMHLKSSLFVLTRVFSKEIGNGSPYPLIKMIEGKANSDGIFSKWNYQLLSYLTSDDLIMNATEDCYEMLIRVYSIHPNQAKSLLDNQTILKSKLFPFLLYRSKIFLDESFNNNLTLPDYFRAISSMFLNIDDPCLFFSQWESRLSTSINDDFSRYISSNIGNLLAHSFFFIFRLSFAEKHIALRVLFGISIPYIVRDSSEKAASFVRMIISLKMILYSSPSTSLIGKLQILSSYLHQHLCFCTEQFIFASLTLSLQEPNMLYILLPWIKGFVVSIDQGIISSTESPFFSMSPKMLIEKILQIQFDHPLLLFLQEFSSNESSYLFLVNTILMKSVHSHKEMTNLKCVLHYLFLQNPELFLSIMDSIIDPSFYLTLDNISSFERIVSLLFTTLKKVYCEYASVISKYSSKFLSLLVISNLKKSKFESFISDSCDFNNDDSCIPKNEISNQFYKCLLFWAVESNCSSYSIKALKLLTESSFSSFSFDYILTYVLLQLKSMFGKSQPQHQVLRLHELFKLLARNIDHSQINLFWGLCMMLNESSQVSSSIVESVFEIIQSFFENNPKGVFSSVPHGFNGIIELFLKSKQTYITQKCINSIIGICANSKQIQFLGSRFMIELVIADFFPIQIRNDIADLIVEQGYSRISSLLSYSSHEIALVYTFLENYLELKFIKNSALSENDISFSINVLTKNAGVSTSLCFYIKNLFSQTKNITPLVIKLLKLLTSLKISQGNDDDDNHDILENNDYINSLIPQSPPQSRETHKTFNGAQNDIIHMNQNVYPIHIDSTSLQETLKFSKF